MMQIDWNKITTDELLEFIPDTEDDRWEHKAKELELDNQKFKLEMQKQVSAFANSGGGYIVLGLNTKREWSPLPDRKNGGTTMKDYLAAVVTSAVEYPIRGFRVHPIKFTVPQPAPNQFAYVIEIDGSMAVHQAREEKIYYWRIDGHSHRAPHNFLELVRNQTTKAVLEIKEKPTWKITKVEGSNDRFSPIGRLHIQLNVMVENTSMQCATNWGVHIKQEDEQWDWQVGERHINSGVCVHGGDRVVVDRPQTVTTAPNSMVTGISMNRTMQVPQLVLLPGESQTLAIPLMGMVQYGHVQMFVDLWRKIRFVLRPVSHNHVGEPIIFGEWPDKLKAQEEFLPHYHRAENAANP